MEEISKVDQLPNLDDIKNAIIPVITDLKENQHKIKRTYVYEIMCSQNGRLSLYSLPDDINIDKCIPFTNRITNDTANMQHLKIELSDGGSGKSIIVMPKGNATFKKTEIVNVNIIEFY